MVATAAETEPMITPARRATCIAVSTKKREGQEINEFDHRQIRAVQNYRKASPKFPRELLTSRLPFPAPAVRMWQARPRGGTRADRTADPRLHLARRTRAARPRPGHGGPDRGRGRLRFHRRDGPL